MANAAIVKALMVLKLALTNKLATLIASQPPEVLWMLEDLNTSMNNITSELQVMKVFIEQIELTEYRSKSVSVWLGDIENIAIRIKDTVDEFIHIVDKKKYSGTWSYLNRFFKDRKSLVHLKLVVSELQAIERNLEHLAKVKDLWVPTTDDAGLIMNSNEYAQHLPTSTHLIDEDYIVGIEENRVLLSSWLNSEEIDLSVISVWGRAGVGKTTLVSNVFNIERTNFDCSSWVPISISCTTENILRNIISDVWLDGQGPLIDFSIMGLGILKENLRDLVKEKKIFIVLDDMWNPKAFQDIIDIFSYNRRYSRILITTRMDNLAPDSNMLELKPLSEEESWDLFCRKAFHLENNHECPPALEEWAREIVLKCGGLPLALDSLGAMLSIVNKTESEWKRVNYQLNWEFDNNPSIGRLKNILILSFKYLPNYLRKCFLYCSLISENSLLSRKKLSRLWIAEGFIEQNGRGTLEEVAEEYLNELIYRSMLQVVKKDSTGRVKRCRINATLRELAIHLCMKEKFGFLHNDNNKVNFKHSIRRLSISKQIEEVSHEVNLTYLITFMSVDLTLPSSHLISLILDKSRYLVVLNLEGLPIKTIPNAIENLLNLRYLGLRGTKVKFLPKCIEKLDNLQTLDLKNSEIQELPDGIEELKKLRHLFAQVNIDPTYRTFQCLAGVSLPKGIFYLKELQTIQSLESNANIIRALKNLTQLRSFRILNVEGNHSAELCRSLSNMSSLCYLSIYASKENLFLQLEDLKFLPKLQKLCLFGRLKEQMLKSPLFGTSGEGIQILRLGWSQLQIDPLPSLSRLENLTWLTLQKAYVGQKLLFKAEWFPKLRYLSLRQMSNLVEVEIEQGTMVSLVKIQLLELQQLEKIPKGMEFLINLQCMVCKHMPAGFGYLARGIHELYHFRCIVL